MHFSATRGYVDVAGRSLAMGRQTSAGWGNQFPAKCVNITRQMLTAAALLVCNLFSRRIGAIVGMFSRRAGLSASAGLSCSYFFRVLD